MDILPPRTRSRARAEGTVQKANIDLNHPAPIKDLAVEAFQKAGRGADHDDATPEIQRQSSLIPSYRVQDRVEDISLECMIGTPFTVAKPCPDNYIASAKPTALSASPFIDEVAAARPLPGVPAPQEVKIEAEEEEVDSGEEADSEDDEEAFVGVEEGLEGDDVPSSPDSSVAEEISLAALLGALQLENGLSARRTILRGVPEPEGRVTKFEDEEDVAADTRVLLLGIPTPKGKHTRFDD